MNRPLVKANKTVKKGLAPRIRKLALDYPEMSKASIARKVGCTPGNVTTVLKTFLNGTSENELRQFQDNKPDILDSLSMRVLGSIDATKIKKASALQLVTAYGILHDKRALLLGQPTAINVSALVDVAKAIRALRDA